MYNCTLINLSKLGKLNLMNLSFLLSAILVQLLPFTLAHSHHGKFVKQVKGDKFNSEVIKNERPAMVKFYSPNCGHCRNMIPAYNKLAENLKDLVDIVAVDCSDYSNQPICEKYRIEGYPTLKLFVVQESESEKGKKKKIVLDYNGNRSTEEMTKFIKYRMHQFIFKVSSAVPKSGGQVSKWNVNFENFFAKAGKLPKLLLFRSNIDQSPTILFRALSIKYHYKIVVGEVSTKNDPEFAAKFNLPTEKVGLIYFPEGNEDKFVTYDGKITRDDIFSFLDKQLVAEDKDKAEL